MQPIPKKSNRPLPEGWGEKDTLDALNDACSEIFGEFIDANGVLKVTHAVIRRALNGGKIV